MKPKVNIEKLVKKFCAARKDSVSTTDRMDKQILNDALAAYNESQNIQTAALGPNISRTIMRRPAVRAAAAAIIFAAALVGGFYFGKFNSGLPTLTPYTPTMPMKTAELAGTVLVKHKGLDFWEELKTGSNVYLGDIFHSTSKSKVVLEFEDKSTVTLNSNSMLILELYNGGTYFYLQHGEMAAALNSPHPPFIVSTPNGRVEAIGTKFTVSVE